MFERTTQGVITLLRNEVSDPRSRGADQTDSFTGDGTATTFTLTKAAVKNVKSCTVAGVTQYEGEDFSVDYENNQIIFVTAPALNAAISITYHYDQTWIYPDYPREDATMPRISVFYVGGFESRRGIGEQFDATTKKRMFVASHQIDIWIKKGDVWKVDGTKISGGKLLDVIADDVLDALVKNKEWLYRAFNIHDLIVSSSRDWGYDEDTQLYRKTITIDLEVFERTLNN